MSRAELRHVRTPAPKGPRHRPVPHHELVETLDQVLNDQGLQVVDERLALAANGTRLFGVLKVRPTAGQALEGASRPGQGFALGFRSGNSGDLAIKLVAGLSVFVCDNLVLAGECLALRRKHTTGLRLEVELREAVERYQVQQAQVVADTDRARELVLTDDEARLEIFRAFERRLVRPRLFPSVVTNYFAPQADWTDCAPRSRWGLHNSFTRALRDSPPAAQFRATAALAYLLRPGRN